MTDLTHQCLLEALSYDPETGKFHWLKRTSKRVRIGQEAGSNRPDGYLEIGIYGQSYLAHRLAWFYMTNDWPTAQIDHQDTVKLNNKWSNLRLASHGQNVQNSGPRKNNKCGFKGVSPSKHRWQARIMAEKRLYIIGYYATPEEASAAYEAKAAELHGEFARVR
jgi:hypothetical protein